MQTARHRWYFLPSPLLGPASWQGVANAMERDGQPSLIAKTIMTRTGTTDHLTPWVDQVLAPSVPGDDLPVAVVGHSAACPRVPLAAQRLFDNGWNVTAMVCVDGRFPDGRAFTESGSHIGDMLDGLVRPDDYLPPWPRWWGSLVEGLVVDPSARDLVFSEAKPIPRSWFDQACPVPDLPATVGRAFLSFGPWYAEARDRAHDAGWLTYELNGDHLHQVVAPDQVAKTLIALLGCLESGS